MYPRTSRRTALRTLGVVLVPGLAGCLSDDASSPETRRETPETATATPEPIPSTTEPTTEDRTETYVPGWENPEPEKDHDVFVENRHDQAHTVEVRVTHEGSVVFEESFEAEPGFDRSVYNFVQSPIDGIASYVVRATLEDGTADAVTFATDSCHGHVVVSIGENGELAVFYSIC